MTTKEARAIRIWFQKNIGLLGWKVSITIGDIPPEALLNDIEPGDRWKFCGRSVGYAQFHRAVIWIHPKSHEDKPMINSEEETLLHELLHCFHALVGMEENGQQCEWANSRLAAVLVKQYRADSE